LHHMNELNPRFKGWCGGWAPGVKEPVLEINPMQELNKKKMWTISKIFILAYV